MGVDPTMPLPAAGGPEDGPSPNDPWSAPTSEEPTSPAPVAPPAPPKPPTLAGPPVPPGSFAPAPPTFAAPPMATPPPVTPPPPVASAPPALPGPPMAAYQPTIPPQPAYPNQPVPAPGYPAAAPVSGYPAPVSGYPGAASVSGYPAGQLPPGPGAVVAQIGEITVTSTTVRTPAGEFPLAGSSWHVADFWQTEQKTPTWAIVLAIVGFCILTVFSLFFLLVKETIYRGTVQVTVTNGPRQYVARIPVSSQFQVQQIHQQVNYVRSLAVI